MRARIFGTGSGLICAFLTAPALAGPDWCEMTDGMADAGSLPSAAQETDGTGPLESIDGSLNGPLDMEDMFRIIITDPVNFMAETELRQGGFSTFNTQLWLFDANGFGLLGNDDNPLTGGPGSLLQLPATDGGLPVLPGVGVYFIAITEFGNVPLGGGQFIFDFATTTEISSADGPGAGFPVMAWTGAEPGVGGEYVIRLTGATFAVPSPAAGALWIVALAAWGRRRSR